MFDNLRDFSDNPLYEDDQQNDLFGDPNTTSDAVPANKPVAAPVRKRKKSKKFLGLTAVQRFILSVILMFTVCLMGTMAMVVLGRMSLFGI